MEREIQEVKVAGIWVRAEKLVCPTCHAFYVDTTIDTTCQPWVAICPWNHKWKVELEQEKKIN
jgi:hypothetical protein